MTLPPPPSREELENGKTFLQQVQWSSDWVFRAVDSIELLEGARARRRVSLDCAPSDHFRLSHDKNERRRFQVGRRTGPVIVPLGFMRKGPITNLDAVGPDGNPLVVLTSTQNAQISYWALCSLYQDEIGELDSETASHLRLVVTEPPAIAEAIVESVLLPTSKVEGSASLGGVSSVFIDFARDLASNFILCVALPRQHSGKRTLIKYSYDWQEVPAIAPLQRLAGSFGFGSPSIDLDVPALDWSASYHLEVRMQPPVQARKLTLPANGLGEQPTAYGTGHVLHTSGVYPLPVRDPEARLTVGVEMASVRLQALMISVVTAAVLLAGGYTPGVIKALLNPTDSAVAVLMVVPAVAMALLVGRGEHVMASRLLLPLRFISLACALLLAAAAGSLVGGFAEDHVRSAWRGSGLVVTLVVALQALPYLAKQAWIHYWLSAPTAMMAAHRLTIAIGA